MQNRCATVSFPAFSDMEVIDYFIYKAWHRANPKEDSVKIKRQIIVFDPPDLAAESSFWAALLGGTVDADDDWHSVMVDGEWGLGIQLAPNHVPPEWPEGTPQQIHLDLYVDDLKSAHEEAISLGARLLKPADDPNSAEGFQVYADPAGHPFCLCWGELIPGLNGKM
jgi:predicted enzyme related to lactoylglutathione lyase